MLGMYPGLQWSILHICGLFFARPQFRMIQRQHMKTNRSDNYTWQLLLGAFFVSGVLHVALYGVPFTDGIVQIFDGTVILCWLAALMRRIMDRHMRRFLVTIAALMIGYFALQMCKYKLFADVTALRYVWYCFYIPMSLISSCNQLRRKKHRSL